MSLFGGLITISNISTLLFVVFAVLAVGYALGRITVKGVSLGDAGVFIVALLAGALFFTVGENGLIFAASSTPYDFSSGLTLVESLGLVLFVTSVGFIAGPKFFGNFKRNFKSYVLIDLKMDDMKPEYAGQMNMYVNYYNKDIIPTYEKGEAIRIEFFDDEIEKIKIIDMITSKVIQGKKMITISPATLFAVGESKMVEALKRIREELKDRIEYFNNNKMPLEAERIKSRTIYDLEMLEEVGYCSGIENYSRHMSLREEGETPYTLMDFFGDDFLLMIDESHVTLPQVRGMYNGDRARKMSLVDNGFRLPSALDNRPLQFNEFEDKI